MKLLARAVAERITDRLLANFGQIDSHLVAEIAAERDKLLVSANRVIAFLFTTITIIAVVVFGAADEKVTFLGVTITNPDVFAFVGFLVGNVFYVVSTGMFFKIFVCEYLILVITRHALFADNPDQSAFLRSFHANSLSYLLIYDVVPKQMRWLRRFLTAVNVYSKYYLVVLYGAYYYSVLGFFLHRVWEKGTLEFFIPLVIANVLSIVTSFAIFCIVPPARELETEAPVQDLPGGPVDMQAPAFAEPRPDPFRHR